MLWRERGIKGLRAEFRRVCGEEGGSHERQSAQASDVAVMENTGIPETEGNRRVAQFFVGDAALVVDQQGSGEARLHYDPIAGRQVYHDELRAAPDSFDRRPDPASPELSRIDFAEDVRMTDLDTLDDRPADGAVEIPRDRLGLR